MLSEGPVGDVDGSAARIIEFDKRVRRIAGSTDTEFIDLDRVGVADLFDRGLGMLYAVRGPRSVRDQVAVERCRSRGDLKGRARGGAWRDRSGDRGCAG